MKLGDYFLEKIIGKGCFSEVYFTTRKDDPKKYISKSYDRIDANKKDLKKFLVNEVNILRNLNHPNIIKFQDAKKTNKQYVIILEYCNGGKLSEVLEKYMEKYGKPFPEEIIQHLMRQIIDAIEYMHEKDIIHKFITLDNIFLNYENEEDAQNLNLMKAQIKITDFFFALKCSKSNISYTGPLFEIPKHPLYLKKLLQRQKKIVELGYNKTDDIWSIGETCYEMFLGIPIFETEKSEEFREIIKNIKHSIPTFVTYELISFLNGMLEYDANKRLTASQLSKHDFLKKEISKFKKIILENIEKLYSNNNNDIDNPNRFTTIWSIIKKDDEDVLTSILGSQDASPIGQKLELEYLRKKEIKPSLQIPTKAIPDNPTEKIIYGMSKADFDEMKQDSNDKEVGYVFDNNIFDN